MEKVIGRLINNETNGSVLLTYSLIVIAQLVS